MTQHPAILLIEDSDDDAELTAIAFQDANIMNPIIRFEDGVEALDYLFGRGKYESRDVTDAPAVILLDLNLPKLGGLDVLSTLREDPRTKHLPVVILTSSIEEKDRLAAYGRHANSYVQKPVDHEQFTEAARQLGLYWMVLNLPPIDR